MPESFSQSALRHFADAERLATAKAFHSAGYLIGYSVECAIKATIAGTSPNVQVPYGHLPDIIERAKRALRGRSHQALNTFLKSPQILTGWSTDLRYAEDNSVKEATFQRWRSEAARALAAAGFKRANP